MTSGQWRLPGGFVGLSSCAKLPVSRRRTLMHEAQDAVLAVIMRSCPGWNACGGRLDVHV